MKKKFHYTQSIEINIIDLLICHDDNLFELIKIKIFEKKFRQTKINENF